MRNLVAVWALAVLPLRVAPGQHALDTTATQTVAASLDSLIARALIASPRLHVAALRVTAVKARVGPAGARPDPMLIAGIQNQPLSREPQTVSSRGAASGPEPMTMHVLGVSQTIPFPGKLGLRTIAARREVDAALAMEQDARLAVIHDVRVAYTELAYADRALAIVEQNQHLLAEIIRVTEAHYTLGSGMQQDVLRARIEAARLGQDASALAEERRAQLAALNALLDRPSDAPVESPVFSSRIVRAAVADSASSIRFSSDLLGAPAADSPLPALDVLQAMAIANSPMLREHEARIAAQAARVALAGRAAKPDVDVSLQYGQRNGLGDMVSAIVSVPIAIQHGRKQDEDAAAERAELAALEAEHHAQLNELGARVAKVYADVARQRTQLALNVKAILPQGSAALVAATANYQAGKSDLLSLLDIRSALFRDETAYYRGLADFANTVADLEQLVGKAVLP